MARRSVVRSGFAAGLLATRLLATGLVAAAVAFVAAVTCDGLNSTSAIGAEPAVDFARDIQPILSDNCFHCHGQDATTRKGDLRLDTADGLLRTEAPVVVPRDSDQSELFRRVTSTDADLVMPPPKSGKKLSAKQIELLKRWIDGGATYSQHWSFARIARPSPPTVRDTTWPRNPIDLFVLSRLEREGLKPAPDAKPRMLVRRASLDLTGLPVVPGDGTPEQLVAHATSGRQDTAGATGSSGAERSFDSAYESWVDRLLASPRHGERLAWFWLDAARYSDTDGYQRDETRTNWPWRDWVIQSFNQGLPFDRFTLEQFAGDLLPDSSAEQKVATCFHRNHMANGEGGRDPEESRIDYVIDRVNTLGTLWLGLSLGCCQCHSHKYDPISQADYYRLSAFFNSIDETGGAGRDAKPFQSYQSPHATGAIGAAQRLVAQTEAAEKQARQAAEPRFQDWLARQFAATRGGFAGWRPMRAAMLETVSGTELTQEADGTIQATGPHPRHEDYRVVAPVTADGERMSRVTGIKLEVFPHASHVQGGLSRGEGGHFILTDIKVQARRRGGLQVREINVAKALADYSADAGKNNGYGNIQHVLDDDPRNGWASFGADVTQPRVAQFALAEPLVLDADELLVFEMRHRSTNGQLNIGRFRVSLTDQPGPAVERIEAAPLEQLASVKLDDLAKLDDKLRSQLREQFLSDDAGYQVARRTRDRAAAQLDEAKKSAKVDVMVLAERAEARPTHVLIRGAWDKKGETVERDVPAAIAPWPNGPSTDSPRDRAGLARWLVARDNPLTARVLVNHLWQLCFGAGLVRTPEDFGLQGERPDHRELLDWLAAELQDNGWDLRHVLRLIVTSATYRQSSDVRASAAVIESAARDPDNRLLARGARFRLPSWMIRDGALAVGGLLNTSVGGPPVRPYQPEGVWEEIFMGRFRYEPTLGGEQYRRSIYAFWRRSSAPTFLFDAAQRRVCEVRAVRTNTPLQALTLLNDLTYLEASRAAAQSVLERQTGRATAVRDPLVVLFERVLGRSPESAELAVLGRELREARTYYAAHPAEARRWLAHGQAPQPTSIDATELAAYTVVAHMLLNLDETMTRE